MNRRTENLMTQKFGRLLVVEFSHRHEKQRNAYWKCICDCGNKVTVRHSLLKNGTSTSCGCFQKETASRIIKNEIQRRTLRYGEAARRSLFRSYEKNAKARSIPFELSLSLFVEITTLPCSYCGRQPEQIFYNKNWNGEYIYNGIDRVDSALGYLPENCVSCCKHCNVAKMGLSEIDFLKLVYSIYHYRKLEIYNQLQTINVGNIEIF